MKVKQEEKLKEVNKKNFSYAIEILKKNKRLKAAGDTKYATVRFYECNTLSPDGSTCLTGEWKTRNVLIRDVIQGATSFQDLDNDSNANNGEGSGLDAINSIVQTDVNQDNEIEKLKNKNWELIVEADNYESSIEKSAGGDTFKVFNVNEELELPNGKKFKDYKEIILVRWGFANAPEEPYLNSSGESLHKIYLEEEWKIRPLKEYFYYTGANQYLGLSIDSTTAYLKITGLNKEKFELSGLTETINMNGQIREIWGVLK